MGHDAKIGEILAGVAGVSTGYSSVALAQARSKVLESDNLLYQALLDNPDDLETKAQVEVWLSQSGFQLPYEVFLQFCIDEENQ